MLDQIAEVNSKFPVVGVPTLKLLNTLTPKQTGLFILLVQGYDVTTGTMPYLPEYDPNPKETNRTITALVKAGVLHRLNEVEGIVNLLCNPNIIIPIDYASKQALWDDLNSNVIRCIK